MFSKKKNLIIVSVITLLLVVGFVCFVNLQSFKTEKFEKNMINGSNKGTEKNIKIDKDKNIDSQSKGRSSKKNMSDEYEKSASF